jgi:hypothetical protein
MDVRNRARSGRLIFFAACLHLLMGATALADPMYTIIDLGTGSPTYGVDSSGNGTITGSNGLTYTFNPVQNYLPAQWSNTTQGVPIVYPAPTNWLSATSPINPYYSNLAYSYSNLISMNNQGLAAGINLWGTPDQSYGQAFLTQHQANGSWGTPIPLWSGFSSGPGAAEPFVGIAGISPNGQVLGYGSIIDYGAISAHGGLYDAIKYLYDTKTQSLTNLTSLINSMNWSDAVPGTLQLDNQGRILTQALQSTTATPFQGDQVGQTDYLLLIPQGVFADPIPVPEPESWAVFAILIGGLIAHKRLRSRSRSWT